MKNLLILLFFIVCSSFGPTPVKKKEFTFNVLTDSYIVINGKSNINKFACKVAKPIESKPLRARISAEYKVDLSGAIQVKVEEFECGNAMLNSDLSKTLKVKNYPNMTIHFKSLDQIPFTETVAIVNGTIIIELAGTQKEFRIPLEFVKKGKNFVMKGSRQFSFADFNLTPPKKVGGLIKVKDEFTASFMLSLQRN